MARILNDWVIDIVTESPGLSAATLSFTFFYYKLAVSQTNRFVMPEDFVHPTIDFCDSSGSGRRNSEEIHDGPYYSTIDDLSSDGGYYSPAENSTTVIQFNQQVHIDQSRLLSSAASTATSTQEDLSQNDQDKEGEVSGSVSDQETSKSQSHAENEAQAQEKTQESKEATASLSLSASSLYDDMLWVREDLLVGGDNLFNVNICRLDDLRQAISRLQKETQILEETDLIIKRKINHVASRRVRMRQDLVEDMDNWEFV